MPLDNVTYLRSATLARFFELMRFLRARVLPIELLHDAAVGAAVLPATMLGGGDA